MRSTCDVSSGFRFFKIGHSVKLNKIGEATMPVNPYDDRRGYLRWPHGKCDFDIVNSSEGKCNRGISSTVNIYRETHVYAYIFP